MAFASSGLSQITDGGLNGSGQALWSYRTTEACTAALATGYFVGCGRRGRSGNFGLAVGDLVIVSESTAAPNPGRTLVGCVFASTVDQASTLASSGYNYAFNVTIRAST